MMLSKRQNQEVRVERSYISQFQNLLTKTTLLFIKIISKDHEYGKC